MNLFVAIVGSLLLLTVAAFCVVGLSATFEPTDNETQIMAFRIDWGRKHRQISHIVFDELQIKSVPVGHESILIQLPLGLL